MKACCAPPVSFQGAGGIEMQPSSKLRTAKSPTNRYVVPPLAYIKGNKTRSDAGFGDRIVTSIL
jgi:hypothetical protein